MLLSLSALNIYIPTIIIGDKSTEIYEYAILEAEDWLFSEVLCGSIRDKLEADSPIYDSVLKACMPCIAAKAYHTAIPQLDIIQTENGFAVVNDERLAPASKERVNSLKQQMLKSLASRIGNLLSLLEQNHISDYQSTRAFMLLHWTYINKPLYIGAYGFHGDILSFFDEVGKIRSVMTAHIEPVITRELSQEILTQLRSNSLSEPNGLIIDDLRIAIMSYYNRDSSAPEAMKRIISVIVANPDNYTATGDRFKKTKQDAINGYNAAYGFIL